MQCTKEFELTVQGSCSGLALDAPWTLPPAFSPPPVYNYDFEGYHGDYSGSVPVPGGGAVISVTHRLEYTRLVAGGNVRITHRIVGTIDMTGAALACNMQIRAYSNGAFQDVNQLFLVGSGVTNFDLTAVATSAVVLNNVLYIYWINNDRAVQSFSGTVTVECLP
jgi:hypothetical protein